MLCSGSFTRPRDKPQAASDSNKPVQFEVKGMRVGDKITKDFFDKYCQTKDKLKADVSGSELIKINDKSVFVSYQFDDYKLVGITVSFDSGMHSSLVDAYTEKFGCVPHKVEKSIVKTRMNAEYENITASWITDAGPFVVEKHGVSANKGFAILRSPEYLGYLARQKSKDTESLRDKL